MVINPKYVSENIINTLAHTDTMYVHSVFNSGMNLQAKDRLIYIGLKEGPSAIKINEDSISTLIKSKVNDEVLVEGKQLKLKSVNMIIDLSKSRIKNYSLQDTNITPLVIDKVERIILGYNFMTGFDKNTLDLIQDLEDDFNGNTLEYLNYLLGRGRGLTPSGDDFIVGMLAYHNIKPFLSDEFFELLTEKIDNKVTTDISLNFLKDAREGHFVKEIHDLFDAMSNGKNFIAHIYTIANFGSTSGVDMLSGILAAIKLEKK